MIVYRKGSARIFLEIKTDVEAVPSWKTYSNMATLLQSQMNVTFQEVYENEHKRHTLGHAKYSKNALHAWDRNKWSSEQGYRRPHPSQTFFPSPCYSPAADWEKDVVLGMTDDDGWMYAANWGSEWGPERSFGKMVRRRRWFRIMSLSKSDDDGHAANSGLWPKVDVTGDEYDAEIIKKLLNPSDSLSLEAFHENESRIQFLGYKLALIEKLVNVNFGHREPLLAILGKYSPRLRREFFRNMPDNKL